MIWIVLVTPLSVAALLNALHQIDQDRAPLIPSCRYSVPLLILVLLIQVVAGAFVVYWFSKCCKCARTKKASRVATIMAVIVAVLYAVVIIAFATSVFLFVNKTTNTDSADSETSNSSDSSRATVGSRRILERWNRHPTASTDLTDTFNKLKRQATNDNAGPNDQEKDPETCIKSSSPPFLFATFYLLALLLFFITVVLMTCCDYHYKRTHQNFLGYLHDVVRIYSNEGRVDETHL